VSRSNGATELAPRVSAGDGSRDSPGLDSPLSPRSRSAMERRELRRHCRILERGCRTADVVCTEFGGRGSMARGGVRIELRDEVRAVAYELTTKNRDQWSEAIALCLPVEDWAMGRRTTIHELGPDSGAPWPEDGASTLFDLGLGTLQVDVCVRASNPELLSALCAGRRAVGFRHGQSRNGSHIPGEPTSCVFVTRIGRAEVTGRFPWLTARAPTVPIPIFCRSCFGGTHPATVPIPGD
jgi:hypothetical protein